MISETAQEYFSISSFGQKHEASFRMFWFCTNCINFVWLTGAIVSKYSTPGSLKFLSFFRQNFNLNLLRCRCKNSKRFLNFRPPKLPCQSSANCYKTLERHRELWILCNTLVAWQRFAPKGTLSCFGSDEVPSWKRRSSLLTSTFSL